MTTEKVPVSAGGVPPGGMTGEVLQKIGSADFAVAWGAGGGGGGGSNNPGTTLALSHFTNTQDTTPNILKPFDLFDNTTITHLGGAGSGQYRIDLVGLTFPGTNQYVVHVNAGSNADVYAVITDRQVDSFKIYTYDADGNPFDPDQLNVLVSGDPSLAPPNRVVAPVGQIAFHAASTVPVTWLECNGAAVSRTSYAALFGVIGTTYGNGDGVTTFNLPDLRGEFVRGWDHGRGVDSGRLLGSAQSESTNTLSQFETENVGNEPNLNIPINVPTNGTWSDWSQTANNGGTGSDHRIRMRLSGDETHPRNVAMLPCIKALPDFGDYAAVQAVESYTVTAPAGQTVFNTVNLNVNYCYVFVDGAYQPPSEYTVDTDTQITFSTTIAQNSVVDFVKIYVATTPAASADQMRTALSNDVFVTPLQMRNHPGVLKKLIKVVGRNSDGTCTVTNYFGGTARAERRGTGGYRVLWSTSGSVDDMPTNDEYDIVISNIARYGTATSVGTFGSAISAPANVDTCYPFAQDSTGFLCLFESTASNKQDPKYFFVAVYSYA